MIKTAAIEDIIKAALFTAYLVGETPLSILLVAKVESGKSSIVEKFNPNPGVKLLTDCTAFGVFLLQIKATVIYLNPHALITSSASGI